MEQPSNPNPEQSLRIAEFLTEPVVLVMKSKTTEQSLKAIALFVDRVLNGADAGTPQRENGFVLLAFPASDPGNCNYISNCTREDIIASMKAFIARAEEPAPKPGEEAIPRRSIALHPRAANRKD